MTAPWCSLSVTYTKLYAKLRAALPEGVELTAPINVDDEPETPARYGVKGLPAFALVDADDTLRGVYIGASPPAMIAAWVRELIA